MIIRDSNTILIIPKEGFMIKVDGITKTYFRGEGKVIALKGISLEIPRGDFTAIAGPSGSGKTTLLNLLGCMDQADRGTITINNRDISALRDSERTLFRRKNLGFVFQDFYLIPVLTAYENVALSLEMNLKNKREIRQKTTQILKEVGLEGKEHRLPDQLSGGEQQRVSVARALVGHPMLILADEPTANLDSQTSEDIISLMKKMNRDHGITFVFSTHDPRIMNHAHSLIQLHDGRIKS